MAGNYTEAQKKATLKYMSKTVSIQIRVTSDQREKYRKAAEAQGLSLSQYIIKLLEEA
ncbi:MAG: DUF1778 domain-containing protein [Lachnospiraceae bacterium]|nr:DUF1778 domain-containing protein [Lachnospiraceae bacterium]